MPRFTLHGKLYFAGEYAIVYGLSPAIIMRSTQALHLDAEVCERAHITSRQFKEGSIYYSWNTYTEAFQNHPYIKRALDITQRYLSEHAIALKPVGLKLESELDSSKNQKYGLGSSASLTVGLIKSISSLHGLHLSPLELFKLSVLSQFNDFPHSSYGDLACVAYDSWVYYDRFNVDFLKQHSTLSLHELCALPWQDLTIQAIKPFKTQLLVVYTNHAANTHDLVKLIGAQQHTPAFIEFSNESRRLVSDLHHRWNQLDSYQILQLVTALQSNLKRLAKLSQTDLITEDMDQIASIVHAHQGAMKFSGAGGGDCVLCFFSSDDNLNQAQQQLNAAGYETFFINKETS
jgi:phosphomevalonate kinase